MCTVTVVPGVATGGSAGGDRLRFRLVCNRDEQRGRARSTKLVRCTLGRHTVVMPVDPESGGTWIGANSTGLVACLLNANPGAHEQRGHGLPGCRSRGEIVPTALEADSTDDAIERLRELNAQEFPPFRLLLLDEHTHAIGTSGGASLTWSVKSVLEQPLVLTSSGLGDALVEPARRELFARMFADASDPLEAQARYHGHFWPAETRLSVLMSRPDARTVSRTSIDVHANHIALRHGRLDDELLAEAVSLEQLAIEHSRLAPHIRERSNA